MDGASCVAQQSKTLHRSAICVDTDAGSIPVPAVTGRPMRRRTIGPVLSELGEGLAGWDVHVPSRCSDSCGTPDACTLVRSPGGRVSSATLVWLASGLSVHCVKKQCCLAGVGFVDARLATFASPEAVRWDKTIDSYRVHQIHCLDGSINYYWNKLD